MCVYVENKTISIASAAHTCLYTLLRIDITFQLYIILFNYAGKIKRNKIRYKFLVNYNI